MPQVTAVDDRFGTHKHPSTPPSFAAKKACEVLVTVEPQHFVRNLDAGRADEVFRSQDWRAVEALPAEQKRMFIAERLIETMRAAGFRYVISFGLETERGSELLLQFGTNHIRGAEKFKESIWRGDPIGGAQFRDPNDPDQMLLALTPKPNLAPLRRLLLAELADQPERTATIDHLRAFTREHTIYREPHTALALDELRARKEITTQPVQSRIRPHTRRTVRVTAPSPVHALFE